MRIGYRDGILYAPVWVCAVLWSCRLCILICTGALVIEMTAIADMSIWICVAVIAASFIGAVLYSFFCYLGRLEVQRTQADEMKLAAAKDARELSDVELIEINKVRRISKIYLAAILGVAIGATVVGVFITAIIGDRYLAIEEDFIYGYAIIGFFAGIISAVFLERFVATPIANRQWEKQKQAVFRAVTESLAPVSEAAAADPAAALKEIGFDEDKIAAIRSIADLFSGKKVE